MAKNVPHTSGPTDSVTEKWYAETTAVPLSLVPKDRSRLLVEFASSVMWTHLNKNNFGGILKILPEFRIHDTADALGYFHPNFPEPGKCLIELSPKNYGLSDDAELLTDTLLHEMCHQVQWEQGFPLGHNHSFTTFAKSAGIKE